MVIAAALSQNAICFREVVIHTLAAKANCGQSSPVMSRHVPKCYRDMSLNATAREK